MFGSLKKNDKIKELVVSTVTEKTENSKTVIGILQVLGEKYIKTVSKKCVSLMADMADNKMDGKTEATTDKVWKMMAEVKKLDLVNDLYFAIILQFIERLEKNGKINSNKKWDLRMK